MKETYYGFTGNELINLGEYNNISEALYASMCHDANPRDYHFFYITSAEGWQFLANKMLDTLNTNKQ